LLVVLFFVPAPGFVTSFAKNLAAVEEPQHRCVSNEIDGCSIGIYEFADNEQNKKHGRRRCRNVSRETRP
jgi:hypothetical protein